MKGELGKNNHFGFNSIDKVCEETCDNAGNDNDVDDDDDIFDDVNSGIGDVGDVGDGGGDGGNEIEVEIVFDGNWVWSNVKMAYF